MEMNLTHEIKEIYDVKTPRHIEFGDPLYYEEYHGKELAGLVIDYKPPQFFQTRLVLRERQYEEFDGAKFLAMVIYFGPPELMHVYLQDKYFKSQTIEEKEIGLDTGRYNLVIDGIGKEVDIGADDYCGRIDKYVCTGEKAKMVLGAVLTIEMPSESTFDEMKKLAAFYFKDMKLIERREERPTNTKDDPIK